MSPLSPPPPEVIWHELECGFYSADLPLWSELAEAQPGPLLDVGAGGGRVALQLAREGHRVIALDRSAELLAALRANAGELDITTVCADARSFELSPPVKLALCIVPMQTIQLLGGGTGRTAFFAAAAAHLQPGGLLACAIVEELERFDCGASDDGPPAECRHIGGRLYSSRATRVALSDTKIVLERERTIHADGQQPPHIERDLIELDRVSQAQLWQEAESAGLRPQSSRAIAATDEYAASKVVLLRA